MPESLPTTTICTCDSPKLWRKPAKRCGVCRWMRNTKRAFVPTSPISSTPVGAGEERLRRRCSLKSLLRIRRGFISILPEPRGWKTTKHGSPRGHRESQFVPWWSSPRISRSEMRYSIGMNHDELVIWQAAPLDTGGCNEAFNVGGPDFVDSGDCIAFRPDPAQRESRH